MYGDDLEVPLLLGLATGIGRLSVSPFAVRS
jgi:hypothetical protein